MVSALLDIIEDFLARLMWCLLKCIRLLVPYSICNVNAYAPRTSVEATVKNAAKKGLETLTAEEQCVSSSQVQAFLGQA